jgi:outer membrane autotransporter protein
MDRRIGVPAAGAAMLIAASGISLPAKADLIDLIPQLQSPIEIAAARANQSVYDLLTTPQQVNAAPTCDPLLISDPGQGTCTGDVFRVFAQTRELVHNANELTGDGPTGFSLGLDRQRLGFALRWTAAEELAAQGNAATRFSGSQLNSLAARLSALRFGARGFRVVATADHGEQWLASNGLAPLGGGASADDIGIAKRWGGFIDGSFGYGNQADTTHLAASGSEDAFDYDGLDVTAGLDYRLGQSTVFGVLLGHTERRIDFDSTKSIVDGSIDSDGQSVMLYALWEREDAFISGSIGVQSLGHDMVRRIAYPSLNPLVAPVDETALSSTDSKTLLGSFAIGHDWRRGGFTFEPYLRGEFQSIRIDGFSERNADGFDFTYGEQTINSFDAAFGIKLQHVLTPPFGIAIPFVRAELHREFGNDERTIDAVYSGIAGATGLEGAQNFNLATNEPDDQFYSGAIGVSLVFKHGLQAFLQYQQTFELEHTEDQVFAGGIRFEF